MMYMCFSDLIFHVCFAEEARRADFMNSICTKTCNQAVSRANLFDDLMQLYADEAIATEYPMFIKFLSEPAVDCGGVSRDMLSEFWEQAYIKLFDGSRLLTPSIEPHCSSTHLKVIGRILSHGYLCTGFLPTRVALPALMGMLLGPGVEVGGKVYLEAFLDYVSEVDRFTINQALAVTGSTFPDSLKERLIEILSAFNCRQVPTPETLRQTLLQVSKYVFQSKPMLAICEINSGIPEVHKPFWSPKITDDVCALYRCMSVTPSKLLALLQEPIFSNKAEATVFGYLQQFIGNMSVEQARSFIRFVSGSTSCMTNRLEVQFNTLSGLSRRPIAHTCSSTLEIPSTYDSYPEFEKEFNLIISNKLSMTMDAL